MTTDDLARLRSLAEAATPGPWKHGPLFWEVWQTDTEGVMQRRVAAILQETPGDRAYEPDAAYIAALDPQTVLALLGAAALGLAWNRVEAALHGLHSYEEVSVALDGPGYVARSGDDEAWSVDESDPITWRVDEPASPTAALLALAEKLEARNA